MAAMSLASAEELWATSGGWLRNHHLIGGKHPIIYRVSTLQGDAGFLPSTVVSEQIGEINGSYVLYLAHNRPKSI